VPGVLSLGVKRPGREADHLPSSNAEIKECVELYLHSPNTPSWHGTRLKHEENLTFTCTFTFIIYSSITVYPSVFFAILLALFASMFICLKIRIRYCTDNRTRYYSAHSNNSFLHLFRQIHSEF